VTYEPTEDELRPLSGLALGVTLRPFQARAFAELTAKRGETALHVVAPPGSGKTVLGLAYILDRGFPAVVVSPTGTIAAQWIDKFQDLVVDTGLGELPSADVWIHRDPYTEPGPVICSVTYQALSVKDRSDGSLHDNVGRLFARFRALGVRTIVLDESHHLKNHWATAIQAFVAEVPNTVLLALTATPPIDATAEERRRHVGLVGEVDYEIGLPSLVKSGYLAPFQDLVHLVQPTAAEHGFLAGAHERFEQVWLRLMEPPHPLDSLRLWLDSSLRSLAHSELEDPGAGEWAALLRESPDLAIAKGRVVREVGGLLPELLWALDEMDERAQLGDKILVIQEYLKTVVLPARDDPSASLDPEAAKIAGHEIWEDVRSALRPIGYVVTRTGIQRRASSVDRLVGLSAAKYDALIVILREEAAQLHDDLRAVVVTDFERAASGKAVRELQGVLDPTAGGAVSVLRRLAVDEVLRDLDAVMISGKSLVCDADVVESVVAYIRSAADREGLEVTMTVEQNGALAEIVGGGRDWNSSTYVLLVTALFEGGVTRCLVGTRGLLGEGWDAKSANVLVDLTAVSAYVSTNQLRGRCLRLDPERPNKVANLWDVVTVAPDMERGFADWDRLVRKHSHAFGLADDGEIERGVGHVHPTFTHIAPSELAPAMVAINAEMLSRVGRRDSAYEAWGVGGEYGDERVVAVELRPPGEPPDRPPAIVRVQRSHALAGFRERADAQRDQAFKKRAEFGANRPIRVAAIAKKYEFAASSADRPAQTALVVYQEQEKAVATQRALAGVGVVFGAIAALLMGDIVMSVVSGLIIAAIVGGTFRAASKKLRGTRLQLEDAKSEAVVQRRAAEVARDAALATLELLETELGAQLDESVQEAELIVHAAETSMDERVDSVDEARLYGEVVLAGMKRLAVRGQLNELPAAAVVGAHRRVDGSVSVVLDNVTAEQARVFGTALRELVGPITTQRYLLVVDPDLSLAEKVADGAVAIPVPAPFSASRRGAREFMKAFSRSIGPAELVYTRTGKGREMLALHARKRWSQMRGFTRETWR
jgi:superfamily II DNA or RNA helicase